MATTDLNPELVLVRASEAQRGNSEYLQGVTREVLANNPNLLLAKHHLPRGSHVDRHQHPQDQLVYMISGRLRWDVGGKQIVIAAGDSIIIRGGVPHECWSEDDTVSLDIFHPTRPDFVNEGH
jgi:quercetin dioxygenase-like cupin family protein